MHAEPSTSSPGPDCVIVPVLQPRTPAWEAAESLLGRDDRARFAAYNPTRRAQFLTARTELRRLGARQLAVRATEIEITARCPHCHSTEHGRPTVTASGRGLHSSIAHAGNYVLAAVSPDRPLGADLERCDGVGFDGFDETALAPTERSQVAEIVPGPRGWLAARFWTAKEAALKVTGAGLTVDPRSVVVDHPAASITVATHRPLREKARTYGVTFLTAPDGYVACVAM